MAKPWYTTAFRRNVIDMHITDLDERFMAEFDPKTYVDMLVLSRCQSAVVYAHSHVGLCFFPTKVGKMHPGLKGRNILREVTDLCHENGIAVVIYVSAIYDTWAYRNHPDWKIIGPDGRPVAEQSRYGVCCPNSPYRGWFVSLAEEICHSFDIEGIRFDMTFWPAVCYCRHCQERYGKEVGKELPRVVNWEAPDWVAFQRKREDWLVEFAGVLTAAVKAIKPTVSVEHQASTYASSWRLGVTHRLAEHCDFLQGDFYGGPLEGSFARKLFHNLTKNRPGGFETSIGADLRNFTALKPLELMQAKAAAALADASAFIFIDSIDPAGTLNRAAYERMGRVFGESAKVEPYLGGDLCQDVAVYLSTESKCDFADNGQAVDGKLSGRTPHVEAAFSAAKTLIEKNVPFGVITKKNIGQLARHQVVVLPNVLMMDREEADAIRDYVRKGGSVYASKWTSLITKDGRRQPDFLLADVFGVSWKGETREKFSYIAPTSGSEPFFVQYTARHPMGLYGSQMVVEAGPGVEVLGTLVLPYTDPDDPLRYASIHNNPPGIYTGRPALVLNSFGRGKAVYASGDLENVDPNRFLSVNREVFYNLLLSISKPFTFESNAPKPVEVTAFHQKARRRFIISLVNFQAELPNIPVSGIQVRFRLGRRRPKALLLLPDERNVSFRAEAGCVEFRVPRFQTLAMLALDYE